jgi:hypothetical protein
MLKYLRFEVKSMVQVLIGGCDQGSPCSIYGQNMKPKDSSLGNFNLIAGLFATTVLMCNNEHFLSHYDKVRRT